jgi:hypothetical protein
VQGLKIGLAGVNENIVGLGYAKLLLLLLEYLKGINLVWDEKIQMVWRQVI